MKTKTLLLNSIFRLQILLVSILTATPVLAADLQEVYRLALENDPQYLQTVAGNLATREQKPQAWSNLLPSVSLSARTSNSNSQRLATDFTQFPPVQAQVFNDVNSHDYSFSLSQPVFNWGSYLQLKKADASIMQSDAQLLSAEQSLMLRVTEAYFNVLGATDSLEFARAETLSLGRSLEQVKQRQSVGLESIVNVEEQQAGYDAAVAREIAAENAVDNTREALREIIGNYIVDFEVLAEEIPLVTPDPDSIEEWTNTAQEQNLNVLAAMYAVDAARQQVKITKADRLPTVDLSASKGYNSSGGGQFGSNTSKSENIGLSLRVPMFSGGAVSSRVRQSIHQLDQEIQRLEQQRRTAQRQTRQSYLGVVSGISEVRALIQAVTSRQTALEATKAGFDVGRRTAVDIVGAESNLSNARRNLARARYDYLLDTLRLKQAAGILTPEDISNINQLLD